MQPAVSRVSRILTAVIVFAVLALPVTGFLIYAHFVEEASSFCTFGESFNCGIVNQSIYSEIFGIPVSLLGFLTYLVIIGIAWNVRRALRTGLRGKFSTHRLLQVLAVISGFGTAFSLYLTYIEWRVLMTWCIFCVVQQILIFIIFVLSLLTLRHVAERKKESTVCEFC